MRFSIGIFVAIGFAALSSALSHPHVSRDVDPCTAPAANASVELGNWLECQVNKFFPYPANGDWASAYDAAFSKEVLASFNQTRFDFDGFKTLYTGFNKSIGMSFKQFNHGFIHTTGVPNSNGDKGGFVYLTGWEGGVTVLNTSVWFEDATFAVVADVGGERKIVEFREASNIPNSGALPPSQDWSCTLPGN